MRKYVITDMGKSYKLDIEMLDCQGRITNEIARYGVWKIKHSIMTEVIESDNDLDYLKKKYDTERVLKLLDDDVFPNDEELKFIEVKD